MNKILCDKCNSGDVENFMIDEPQTPPAKSMSEFIGDLSRVTAVPAIMVYTRMRLHCKSCQYTLDYSI